MPVRKITDLKPNEFIYIKTRKQAKKMFKICGFKAEPVYPVWIGKRDNFYFQQEEITAGIEYPASDFKKKSKYKRLEKRVEALEREKLIITTSGTSHVSFEEILKKLPIVNPDFVEEKTFVLPEKFCVLRNSQNYNLLNSWANKINGREEYTCTSELFLYVAGDEVYDCIGIPDGYTEITTEQFIEHVLNCRPRHIELKVGTWYEANGCLMCPEGLNLIDGRRIKGYGFDLGRWFNDSEIDGLANWQTSHNRRNICCFNS